MNIAEKVGKVEIILKKKDNMHWKMLGQPLEHHNTFIKCKDRGKQFHGHVTTCFKTFWSMLGVFAFSQDFSFPVVMFHFFQECSLVLLKAAREFSLKGFNLGVGFCFALLVCFVLFCNRIGGLPVLWKDWKNLVGEGEDCLSIVASHGYLCA